MLRFHLHQYRHGQAVLDEAGGLYRSLEDAIGDAAQAAREIMAERIRQGEQVNGSEIHIADDRDRVLEIVKFADVLTGKRFPPPPIRRPEDMD